MQTQLGKANKDGVRSKLIVNKEVERLHAVNFIKLVEYPTWVSNIVVVPKRMGNYRMYQMYYPQ